MDSAKRTTSATRMRSARRPSRRPVSRVPVRACLVCGVVAAGLLACDSSSSRDAAPAPNRVPVVERPAPAPPAQRPADAAKGATSYAIYCASCHGPSGDGDGPVGQSLEPKPAKHHDGHYMNALSNEHLFKVIKEGGAAVGKSPMMAPWAGSLSDQQIRELVAFVRSLADPPYAGPLP